MMRTATATTGGIRAPHKPSSGAVATPSRTPVPGNQSRLRLLRAMALRRHVAASNAPHEREASDAGRASQIAPCHCGGSCPKCKGAPKGPTAATADGHISAILPGSGRPLENDVRHRFERHLGQDLSNVRVHIGPDPASAARALGAAAFTTGRHIIFGENEYQPSSVRGKKLLSHELFHTVHGEGRAPGTIWREEKAPGSSTESDLSGVIPGRDLAALSPMQAAYLRVLYQQWHQEEPSNPIPAINAMLLAGRAAANPAGPDPAATPPKSVGAPEEATIQDRALVPRPAGVSLDGGYMLVPVEALGLPGSEADIPGTPPISGDAIGTPEPASLDADLSAPLPGGPSPTGLLRGSLLGGGLGGTYFNPMYAGGFDAAFAKSSGIGIIALSHWDLKEARKMLARVGVPDYKFYFGHSAIYIRVNGQIVMTRGYQPESMMELLRDMRAVERGEAAVQGAVGNNEWMWDKTSAMTGEIELTAEEAMRALKDMPDEGRLTSPSKYSAAFQKYLMEHPNMSPEELSNCVRFGRCFVEEHTGIKIGDPVQGVEDTQGGIQKYLKRMQTEHGPVKVSRMPLKYQIVKWGGRSMAVIGYGLTAYEIFDIARGPASQRGIRGTRLAGSFLGGLAAGSGTCLLCGPGAPVCLVVGGFVAGAVGSGLGEEVAGGAYEEWDMLWKTDWGVVLSGYFRARLGAPFSLR